MKRRGTVLMECVVTLPLLTALIFAIVQFALVWYAQLLTHYAAYNAARAALVYHPGEYRVTENKVVTEKFLADSGVCWSAAVRTLAPLSFSPSGGTSAVSVPGWNFEPGDARVPNASRIGRQVRIHADECVEGDAYVRVRVDFDFPLAVPVVGKMLANFQHALDAADEVRRNVRTDGGDWEVWGWHPSAEARKRTRAAAANSALGMDYLTLHAYCALPKPWESTAFARVRDRDLEGMVK